MTARFTKAELHVMLSALTFVLAGEWPPSGWETGTEEGDEALRAAAESAADKLGDRIMTAEGERLALRQGAAITLPEPPR